MRGMSPKELRAKRIRNKDRLELTDDVLLLVGRPDEDGRVYAITLGALKAYLRTG